MPTCPDPNYMQLALTWLGAVPIGVTGWFAVNFIAKPILEVRDLRRQAFNVIEKYVFVGMPRDEKDEDRVQNAHDALSSVGVSLRAFGRSYTFIGHMYCRICGYNLEMAACALFGLAQMAGWNYGQQARENQRDLVYVALKSCEHISGDRKIELQKMYDEVRNTEIDSHSSAQAR